MAALQGERVGVASGLAPEASTEPSPSTVSVAPPCEARFSGLSTVHSGRGPPAVFSQPACASASAGVVVSRTFRTRAISASSA